jgi:succinate dehydrogenase / fumarate reductase, cytochrome b subunit
MSWTSGGAGLRVVCVAIDLRPTPKEQDLPDSATGVVAATRSAENYWSSTIGKKAVMAVTGLLMVLFLFAHMLGNLKIFFGPNDFNGYAHWLRTIGEPVLHNAWYLWIQRFVLVAAVVLHVISAAELSRRDRAARPTHYQHHQRWQAGFATSTMRWGGVIIGLFVVWHILDLTVGVANPHFIAGQPYQNVVVDFQVWWIDLIYIAALVALGFHINHGFSSAARTLGIERPNRARAIRIVGTVLALSISLGFIAVPVGVMAGVAH